MSTRMKEESSHPASPVRTLRVTSPDTSPEPVLEAPAYTGSSLTGGSSSLSSVKRSSSDVASIHWDAFSDFSEVCTTAQQSSASSTFHSSSSVTLASTCSADCSGDATLVSTCSTDCSGDVTLVSTDSADCSGDSDSDSSSAPAASSVRECLGWQDKYAATPPYQVLASKAKMVEHSPEAPAASDRKPARFDSEFDDFPSHKPKLAPCRFDSEFEDFSPLTPKLAPCRFDDEFDDDTLIKLPAYLPPPISLLEMPPIGSEADLELRQRMAESLRPPAQRSHGRRRL